ncbi:MAG: transcriptional regulator, partial [Bacteroidota bacterium]
KIIPYEKGIAFANRVIGVAHWAQGNVDLSFRFLIAARKSYQSLQDSLGVANSSLNLGMAYVDQGNYDLASRNYEDALTVFRRYGKTSRIATTYTKIADLLTLQEKYPPAFDYLNQALDLHRQNDFLYGIAEANGKLGELAAARGENDDAISYFLLAVSASQQRNDQFGLASHYYGIGLAYFKKRNVGLAEDYLKRAKIIAETYGLQKVRRDICYTLKELEASKGNYREALNYADTYLTVRDSLFNKEKSNLIANMEARRAFAEQQEQLIIARKNVDLLQQKDKVSRMTKLMLVLILMTALAIAFAILSRKNQVINRKHADLKVANQEKDNLETALLSKERELTSYTLNFVQKNEGITELKQLIAGLRKQVGTEHRPTLKKVERKLDGLLRIDEDWADFRRHFESVHPYLISQLQADFPRLTSNEFRLIALVRLNLSTKEISSVLGISPDSVKTARYRLRKKLSLKTQESLFEFLIARESL